jgi:Na+-transporting NADH:ubiquinone oxidoreductase subunit NqrE
MNEGTFFYLFCTLISIYVSKKFGSIRNIGFTWSVIFSIFCPILSITIVFLSKKKNNLQEIPDIFNWGVVMLICLIFIFIGRYPDNLYQALGAITLPIIIFSHNISGETLGEMSVDNLFTIFPIYGLLRKYTSIYWS